MHLKLTLCLALSAFALPVIAGDTRLSSDGGQECPPAASTEDEEAQARTRSTDKRTGASAAASAKVGERREEASTRPPRWHSFLPGMFR